MCDICRPEARIVSVTNSSEDKIVKVKGHCYRNNQPVIEVVSSFLYRGHFIDYKNTFDTTEEPDYLVHLESDVDVGVLQSKEWFEWDEMSPSLLAGTSIIFHIQSQVSFKGKTAYRNVSVSGDIFVFFFSEPIQGPRQGLWTSNRMIRKAILLWLICNVTEQLRVCLHLSPTVTH